MRRTIYFNRHPPSSISRKQSCVAIFAGDSVAISVIVTIPTGIPLADLLLGLIFLLAPISFPVVRFVSFHRRFRGHGYREDAGLLLSSPLLST